MMIKAIQNDDPVALEPLLNEHSINDVPYEPEFWWTSRSGYVSPIAYAAGQNSIKCVKLLLSKGAIPDGWDSFTDLTALGICQYRGYIDIGKELINYGAQKTGFSLDCNFTVECRLTPELQSVRDEYIQWKKRNEKIAIMLLCAKKHHKSYILDIIDMNIVQKIAKYVKFDCHRT